MPPIVTPRQPVFLTFTVVLALLRALSTAFPRNVAWKCSVRGLILALRAKVTFDVYLQVEVSFTRRVEIVRVPALATTVTTPQQPSVVVTPAGTVSVPLVVKAYGF